MKLRYVVANVGIYLDEAVEQYSRRFVNRTLVKQLDGLEATSSADASVEQKMYIRSYHELMDARDGKANIFPSNSTYDVSDDIFIETHLQFAFRLKANEMHVWVTNHTAVPPTFLLHFLLLQRKRVFVHSCGIAVDGRGILLPGFGGIGKTAIVTEALKRHRNVQLLGDDLVLADATGYLHSYPRPFCIYPYHIPLFQPFMAGENIKIKELTLKNKIERKLKILLDIHDDVAYELQTISPYKVLNPGQIAENPVPLDRVYLLSRYTNISDIECVRLRREDLVAFCSNIMAYEWNAYARVMSQVYAQKREPLSNYYREVEEVLYACFDKTDEFVEVKIPEKLDAFQVADDFLDILFPPE